MPFSLVGGPAAKTRVCESDSTLWHAPPPSPPHYNAAQRVATSRLSLAVGLRPKPKIPGRASPSLGCHDFRVPQHFRFVRISARLTCLTPFRTLRRGPEGEMQRGDRTGSVDTRHSTRIQLGPASFKRTTNKERKKKSASCAGRFFSGQTRRPSFSAKQARLDSIYYPPAAYESSREGAPPTRATIETRAPPSIVTSLIRQSADNPHSGRLDPVGAGAAGYISARLPRSQRRPLPARPAPRSQA